MASALGRRISRAVNQKGVRVRRWQPEDLGAIIACQKAAWPEYPDGEQYGRRTLRLAFAAFPEGQLLAEVDGEVVGYATSVIVDLPAPLEQMVFICSGSEANDLAVRLARVHTGRRPLPALRQLLLLGLPHAQQVHSAQPL